jgi:hypothetical protein
MGYFCVLFIAKNGCDFATIIFYHLTRLENNGTKNWKEGSILKLHRMYTPQRKTNYFEKYAEA